MFSALSEKLTGTLRSLKGRGVLSESDIKDGLREIRRVLLEADVNYKLTRRFVENVGEKAAGLSALKSVRPGDQLVKMVHDELVAMLGEAKSPISFAPVPPTVLLLVGLQGSGKTTSAAKLALRLSKEQKAPFLIAADVYRPAAEIQLRKLAAESGLPVFGMTDMGGEATVVDLVSRGMEVAAKQRARTVIVDTAGRLQIDDQMMNELKQLKETVSPQEVLLVADAMTGQDAVNIAVGFDEAVGITGVVLTKLDGDARGGAALSIYGVTGAPIKYVGTGEHIDDLEQFDPVRMAGRILERGDVVGLVEKAQSNVDAKEAEQLAKRATSKRGMDLEDFLAAMSQIQKMGPLEGLLGMLPGVSAKMVKQAKVDPKRLKHLEAIVLSMTTEERRSPALLNGSRRARIARGSGRPVHEINQLLKQFEQMKKMMKGMGKFAMPLMS